MFNPSRAVARRNDPETSKAAAAGVQHLRASHRFVLQLFRTYGPMTDEQAWGTYLNLFIDSSAARELVPRMSPSGLRSRRAEVTEPRGVGIRDSGRRCRTAGGRNAVVWELAE